VTLQRGCDHGVVLARLSRRCSDNHQPLHRSRAAPFVFARTDRPFVRSGLPMLVGMAVTFAAVATLAAVAGGWAVEANQLGRALAMALLALFGLALLFPNVSARLMAPVVDLGSRLSRASEASGGGSGTSVASSLLLGAPRSPRDALRAAD
jgi:hypothetical protein